MKIFPFQTTKRKRKRERNVTCNQRLTRRYNGIEWIINLTFGEIRGKKRRNFFLNEENNSGGSENMAVFTLVFSLSQIWNLSDYSSVQRTTNLSPRHINGSAHITLWWLSDIFFALSAQILRFLRRYDFWGQRVSGVHFGFFIATFNAPKNWLDLMFFFDPGGLWMFPSRGFHEYVTSSLFLISLQERFQTKSKRVRGSASWNLDINREDERERERGFRAFHMTLCVNQKRFQLWGDLNSPLRFSRQISRTVTDNSGEGNFRPNSMTRRFSRSGLVFIPGHTYREFAFFPREKICFVALESIFRWGKITRKPVSLESALE